MRLHQFNIDGSDCRVAILSISHARWKLSEPNVCYLRVRVKAHTQRVRQLFHLAARIIQSVAPPMSTKPQRYIARGTDANF